MYGYSKNLGEVWVKFEKIKRWKKPFFLKLFEIIFLCGGKNTFKTPLNTILYYDEKKFKKSLKIC